MYFNISNFQAPSVQFGEENVLALLLKAEKTARHTVKAKSEETKTEKRQERVQENN